MGGFHQGAAGGDLRASIAQPIIAEGTGFQPVLDSRGRLSYIYLTMVINLKRTYEKPCREDGSRDEPPNAAVALKKFLEGKAA